MIGSGRSKRDERRVVTAVFADLVGSAMIPLVYGRSLAMVKPWIHGWWEFGKSSSSFADLLVDPSSPRA